MADNKPTFHHLNNSQSQRIFWLLEELGIDYNLVLHKRNPSNDPKAPFRAPPLLRATGPYGKAPALITGPQDGGRYITESSAIATYLIRTFDTEDKFGLRNGDWIRDEVLVSLCSTELSRATAFLLFGVKRSGRGPTEEGSDASKAELKNVLRHLERELKNGPVGGWFMGKQPGRADILLEYPLSIIKHRNWIELDKEFPALAAWLGRVYNSDAWKRCLEKGNGYDLSVSAFSRQPSL